MIEVISIAISGLKARCLKSAKLTFNPNPTIAAVNNHVVSVDTLFITFDATGIIGPST